MTRAPEFTAITSAAELRELLGVPMRRAIDKERVTLHARDREWLARSPFCLISTSDANGNVEAGDLGPGLAAVARPDREGRPVHRGEPGAAGGDYSEGNYSKKLYGS